MDLACLGKQALFIPTPGQTEQEYLAQYFSDTGIFINKRQEDLKLKTDIPEALKKNGLIIQFDYTVLKNKIDQLLNG